jgi:CRISPR/Cas system CMR subunit Cmr4 (Cas7 group RAMP superfamily)
MYSLVLASDLMAQVDFTEAIELSTANKIMDFFTSTIPHTNQIGGNATIGKGIVSIIIGGNHAN